MSAAINFEERARKLIEAACRGAGMGSSPAATGLMQRLKPAVQKLICRAHELERDGDEAEQLLMSQR